jgi:hypothetical protein
MGYTPGPWKVKKSTGTWQGIFVEPEDGGYPVAACHHHPDVNGNALYDAEANARLIASAPDLRALLETVVNGIEDEWTPWFREPLLQDYEREWLEQARAALEETGE